jgi:hypothetical protein
LENLVIGFSVVEHNFCIEIVNLQLFSFAFFLTMFHHVFDLDHILAKELQEFLFLLENVILDFDSIVTDNFEVVLYFTLLFHILLSCVH